MNRAFTTLPDLAVRSLGGGVVAANDELFAERENLIRPESPAYSAATFGHKGQVYDGWETRRRRQRGHPTPDELEGAGWLPLVPRSAVAGDAANRFDVEAPWRLTHLRLCLYPDGGVARLRAHGEPVPDPRQLPPGGLDLAALEHGGEVTGCSNRFYGSPRNLISPGLARVMGEGWETARRRDDGNDWVELRLAGAGVPSGWSRPAR
jgi:allantoicase